MPLLAATDPEPAVVENAGSGSPWLLVCDHAGRLIPDALRDLGLPPAELDRHIAWDIGALGLARDLSRRLGGATLIWQRYSRLVIDCNRDPARADAVAARSDGTEVRANRDLSAGDRAARVAAIHRPYHAAIEAEIDARLRRGQPPALVLIHSFTPVMSGRARPWQVGVLHLGDALSLRALAWLREYGGVSVGDNQPYAMDEIDYTAPTHARLRGLEYLELETRQDLVADAAGQARFAELYAHMLAALSVEA